MRCPKCGTVDLTHVGFQAVDGAEYRYCRSCECGWWERGGTQLATQEILQAASTIEPGRRNAA